MTLGSLFDGSGGFPLGGVLCGMIPLWASEIEPYPIAVTRSRFPDMAHLGSVLEIDGRKIPPVDVITFGSPCQDMSVAGKRAGMKHNSRGDEDTTRSGLFYEAIRIIREMREETNGKYPTFAVWENVPGALSSNGGEDFRCVLEELARIGDEAVSVPRSAGGKWTPAGEIVGDGFSIAWRVLDAQYWGVPQRRRRIYLVADFAGKRAGKILFECESVRGDSAPGGEKGEAITADAAGGAGGSRDAGHVICFKPGQGTAARTIGESKKTAPTLAAEAGGNAVPGICYPRIARTLTAEADASPCIDLGQNVVCYDARGNGAGIHCPTLTGDHENRVTDYTAICVCRQTKIGEFENDGTMCTLMARDYKSPRNLIVGACDVDCRHGTLDEDKTHTLQAKANGGQSLNCTPGILMKGKPPRKYIVRRLTPLECCRLQGFPDGWGVPDHKEDMADEERTFWERVRRIHAEALGKQYKPCKDRAALAKWYNKLHTDSAEYKMWGNGIALPCAAFVMRGIADMLEEEEI